MAQSGQPDKGRGQRGDIYRCADVQMRGCADESKKGHAELVSAPHHKSSPMMGNRNINGLSRGHL